MAEAARSTFRQIVPGMPANSHAARVVLGGVRQLGLVGDMLG